MIDMTTTIQKWGNSQAVRLPKMVLDTMLLQENDKVSIMMENDSIIIKKASRRRRANKSLDERFESYNSSHTCTEYDWGEPVGEEVW